MYVHNTYQATEPVIIASLIQRMSVMNTNNQSLNLGLKAPTLKLESNYVTRTR